MIDFINFHYDKKHIYYEFVEFQKTNEGIEVTEDDLLEAWKAAKEKTNYFIQDENS